MKHGKLSLRGSRAIQLFSIVPVALVVTGCPKIDKDLPPLSEYEQSEGWYEDAFIRVYKSELPTHIHPNADIFTHPWMVLKPANSEHVVVLELTESKGGECDSFDAYDETQRYQDCGHIMWQSNSGLSDIDEFSEPYYGYDIDTFTLGELRGGEEVAAMVDYIFQQTPNYPCQNEYNYLTHNSNTYVKVMLENSGFYKQYEVVNEEPFSMGQSSWGAQFWKNCSIEEPDETAQTSDY
ncbi:MAG: hypothetical protein MI867_07335 [Pseudomonadales bacterium]|nr:hypothetical protein [Pseudomonadales bacterium]